MLQAVPSWSTACPDWEERILEGRPLVPFPPLFPAEADAALELMRELRLVDVAGSPPMGEACRPWVFDFAGAIFGAYNHAIGRRLIRNFLLLIAKKNGKSTIAAAIMLTALMRNWRESAEFYILAPTKEVADNSFLPARDMVGAHPSFDKTLHVNTHQKTITHLTTGAFLKVVAADSETVGGKKATGVFIDELWLFGKRADAEHMLNEATGGLASRPEGFVIYASTQSDKTPSGVFAKQLERFRAIRDGELVDPRSLGVLYEYPERMLKSGDFKRPEYFHIPNPNLGASVDREFLLEKIAEAERSGQASMAIVAAKFLNVQVDIALGVDSWAGAALWPRGIEAGLDLEAVLARCEVVTVGIDGGGLDDLLGIGVIGRERVTKRWLGWARAYISPEGLERRKANRTEYDRFEAAGDLVYVTQLGQDIEGIVAIARQVRDRGLLAEVGVDAAGIGLIVDALEEIGINQDDKTLGTVRQGIGLMGAFKALERKLADGTFRHSGSAMMAWCVGNAKLVRTRTAAMIARDEAGYGKIDPLMALFNAAALMAMNPPAASRAEVAAMVA